MDWQSFAETPLQSAEDMRRQITDKAIHDDGFRNNLVANPKETVAKELGIDLPEDVSIMVHESDPRTIHLALPVSEVSEEDLEAIAAGRCCC